MTNIDFHSLLFPTEFEKLCRDVLEIRESPITFTSYKSGKDGGIDFRATKGTENVIGQCKLYNPNNYSVFIASLKNEVQKCKRTKPERYILCTNFNLSPNQAKEILTIFQGFILCEEDIIDGEKLNKYLGLLQYNHLLKTYSKLLVPNLHFVELALEKIVNRRYYSKTASFLREIDKQHKLFHNTQILKHCIDTLEKNKVIILTGNPGVGKTTTAKMIANFFLNQRVKNILFLSDNDFKEIEGLYQPNQIIIVDDFWGQNFSPSLKEGSLLRNFDRVINDFKESADSYLVLTSREYIIRDVLSHSEHETRKILDTDRFIVNLDDFSNEDRVRIFLNHLLFYDFEKSFFNHLIYSDTLEKIIKHENYSPRHIEYFIKQHLHQNEDSYSFFHFFQEYLDKPNEYWNNNFKKLNGASKLILLILLISSDPIDIIDLETSFEAIQEAARHSLNEKIDPLTFHHELRLLEDFYLFSEEQDYTNKILIHFQSPGIKDFLLEYLRTEGKAWIKPLLENAPFFNQLNFVFSTEEDEINDDDSKVTLYGQKIVLLESLQNILKDRLLKDFHSLNFCAQEREFAGEFSSINTSEETKYWKLMLFSFLFDISSERNSDVRSFMINEVKKDIDCYQKDRKIVNSLSMLEFPRVIKMISPYVELHADYLINCYCDSITFTTEFDSFFKFEEIFPYEFTQFIKKNIIRLKKAVKDRIIDDIDYYIWHDMDIELETHLYYMIGEVCRKYKIRLTSKFIDKIEDMAELPVFSHNNFTKRKTRKKGNTISKRKSRIKPQKFDAIVEEYVPDQYYEMFDPIQYLKNICTNKALITTIKEELRNESSPFKAFTEKKEVFSCLIQFLEKNISNLSNFNHYTLLDSFFTFYCEDKNLDSKIFKKVFFELSENSFGHDFSITKKRLRSIFDKYQVAHYEVEILSPIIIADRSWYNFSIDDFKIYFIAEYLSVIQSDGTFKECVIDYSSDIYENKLLLLLSYKNKDRLHNAVVIPELKRFFSSIDTSTEKTSVRSFLSFLGGQLDFMWDKENKVLEESGSSESEWFIEMIIQYLGIDFSFMNLDVYFLKDDYTEEAIQEYFINRKAYNRLYKHVIRTIPQKKGRHILTDEDAIYLDINLYDFAINDESYALLKEIGMEKYILHILASIQLAMKKIL